ncbi:MAG: MoxR family ATPase [Deltaproteobacteria bacterium]|nr:MoxR family ATPase [Deltaproteobacteria bacterium]
MTTPIFDVYGGDGGQYAERLKQLPAQPVLTREHGKYLASDTLKEAVNLAIAVGQPLLVTGDPGCGKTRLAWSIADELGLEEPLVFNTRSTSRAQDLLYRYDAVRRFHDIQASTKTEQGTPRAEDASVYVTYEALGKAIRAKARRVVLIDEIDKAPRDFPNDLLHELDRMSFRVPEVGNEEQASSLRPIVLITSNSERQLPRPFLRRCVFHYIEFPTTTDLVKIVKQRLGPLGLADDLVGAAVSRFEQVRALPNLFKQPATSELLAWVQALAVTKMSAEKLLSKPLRELPLWQTLIKSKDDRKILLAAG